MSQAFKRKLRLWITATYGGRSTKKIYGSTSSSSSNSSSSSTAEAKQNRTEQWRWIRRRDNNNNNNKDEEDDGCDRRLEKSELFGNVFNFDFMNVQEELRIYWIVKIRNERRKRHCCVCINRRRDVISYIHTHTYWKKRTRIPKIYSQLTQAIHMNGFF